MKTVTMYETFDGVKHDSHKKASEHLNTLYANALCPVARTLAAIDKYAASIEFIDGNLHTFEYLSKIKADFVLANEEDDTSE